MSNSKASEFMTETLEKVRQMIDVNTIIGNPILTADGTTLIPVTKVSIGVGSGGSDFTGKDVNASNSFGGGGGAGISIAPVCFVVISNGTAKILNINTPASSTADRMVEMVPDVVDRITDMFDKKTKKTEEN